MFTQEKIIQEMKALGYCSDTNVKIDGGVCAGIVMMEVQARIIGRKHLKEYKDRIRLILNEPYLKAKIDAVRTKLKTAEILDNNDEKAKHNNNQQEEKKARENVTVEDLNKHQIVVSPKITVNRLLPTSEEDDNYLAVLSYFDGVLSYFAREISSKWFSQKIRQIDSLAVAPYIQSLILAQKGGMVKVYSGTGIYTRSNLSSYMDKLSKILEKYDDIAVQINSSEHSMLLSYDSKTKKWDLSNPDQLLMDPISKMGTVGAVMYGFQEDPITSFSTTIYATKENADKQKLVKIFDELHHIAEYTINKNKAKMITNENISWLWIAACYGDYEVVAGLLANLAKNDPIINLRKKKTGTTPLFMAAHNNNVEEIKILLANGAKIDLPDNTGCTPLFIAAKYGNVEAIIVLLANDARIDLASNDGFTALHIAVEKGHLKAVEILVEALLAKGITLDLRNNENCTSLYIAAQNDDVEIITVLLKNGARIDLTNKSGFTALHIAASKGKLKAVEILIEALLAKGITLDLKDNNIPTPLYLAAQNGHVKIIRILLSKGATVVDLASNNQFTAFHIAAAEGQLKAVEILIEALLAKGITLDLKNNNGSTPLYLAAQNGQVEVIKVLLANGARVDLANNNGFTALRISIQQGHLKVVEILIEALLKKGTKLDLSINEIYTALYLAAEKGGHLKVVEILIEALLEKGVSLDLKNKNGFTALQLAAKKGHLGEVEVLLTKGVSVDLAMDDGSTALHLAAQNGHLKIVETLQAKGASMDLENKAGTTALYGAVVMNHPKVVEFLLEKGARVDCRDKTGRTSAIVAAACGRVEVLKLLIQYHPEVLNDKNADHKSLIEVGEKYPGIQVLIKNVTATGQAKPIIYRGPSTIINNIKSMAPELPNQKLRM